MKFFEKCSYAEIEKHVFTMRELSQCEKDVYIIGKIKRKVPGWTQIKGSGKDTCTAMMTGMKFKCCMISNREIPDNLINLVKQVERNGTVLRCHGNKGKKLSIHYYFSRIEECPSLQSHMEIMLPNLRFYYQLHQIRLIFIENISPFVKRAMKRLSYCKCLFVRTLNNL